MAEESKLAFSSSGIKKRNGTGKDRPPWKILIVDDEPAVHEITRHVLKYVKFEDRNLEFVSAMTKREAETRLAEHPDTALILLDVVMETDHAGLELANYVRNELKNESIRIILRTGQPGEAPERRVILDYDINDYREKADMSATRLATSVIASLRDFSLISRLERCLNGMEAVIEAIRNMLRIRSFSRFCEGLLEQVLALMNLDESGLYLNVSGCAVEMKSEHYTILAGTGEFNDPAYRDGKRELPSEVTELIGQAIENRNHRYTENEFAGFIPSDTGESVRILYLRGIRGLEPRKLHVIETFLTNISAGFDMILEIEHLHSRENGDS